jgi:hypothetical protein
MRRFAGAAVVAAVMVFAITALASGSPGSRPVHSARHHAGKTLRLYAPTVQLKLLDLDDPGFGLGDEAVFSDDLLTAPNGKTVGFDGGVCTVVRVKDAGTQAGVLQCLVTYSLPHGQVTTQALTDTAGGGLAGTQLAAITGGTGRYRNARGQATIEFLNGGAAANVTLSIRA